MNEKTQQDRRVHIELHLTAIYSGIQIVIK